MKYELVHITTCLPDYFGGHHLAHICLPVYRMTKTELINQLKPEVNVGAIMGSDVDYDSIPYDAFIEAIDNIKFSNKRTKYVFGDIKAPKK